MLRDRARDGLVTLAAEVLDAALAKQAQTHTSSDPAGTGRQALLAAGRGVLDRTQRVHKTQRLRSIAKRSCEASTSRFG